MGEERIGKDFSEMLKDELENEKRKGVGFRKLAVLKGDVDSLGKTFYFGLKSSKPDENAYTAARLKTLSMYLNLFFGGYVNWLVEKNDKYKNLYIIFSGGDDFTIVGYWETLIDFARELRCSFDKFASNPEVHFSATIHLMDENWPIYGEVEKADEELVNAKNADENKEKNGVCVFGKAILWKDFDFAMELIEGKNVPGQPLDPGFGKYVAAETVSMGYVRQLHRIAQMIASLTDKDKLKGLTQKQKISLLMWQPYLHYFTERNLAKKQPPPEELWVKSHLYAKDAAALKDLNIFTTYLLYKNRK
jgi:CRISPR-associated protein Csm1